jgi:type IV fimbrial biogenesis protein FimT
MCLSGTPTATNPTCATTGNNWNVGWVVYVEPTCSGAGALNAAAEATAAVAAERLVYTKEAVNTRYNLIPSSTIRFVLFSPRGVPNLSGAASFNIADSYASTADQNKYGRTLCFDKAGRVRSVAYRGSCS